MYFMWFCWQRLWQSFAVIDCETSRTRGHNLRLFKDHCNLNGRLNFLSVLMLMFGIICQLMLFMAIVLRCLNAQAFLLEIDIELIFVFRAICIQPLFPACLLLFKTIYDFIWFDVTCMFTKDCVWHYRKSSNISQTSNRRLAQIQAGSEHIVQIEGRPQKPGLKYRLALECMLGRGLLACRVYTHNRELLLVGRIW